ncbi:MAG: ABC transporter permease [Bacteroidetes bacterium]|nr:ABC transporter permease [Bacteroidota bacterium]
MKFEFYIAKRITFQSKRTFSKTVVRIAIAAIALSLAVMMVSISIVKGFQQEIKNKVTGFASHIQITHTNINYTFENEPIEYSPDVYKRINEIDQVNHLQVFANKPGIIKTQEAIEGVILKGVSSTYDWNYMNQFLREGKHPEFSDSSSSTEILISATTCRKLRLKIGDDVAIYFVQQPPRVRKFTISGIFESGIEEIDEVFAVCDIRQIQKLNNWSENQIGGYEVFMNDLEELERVNDLIRAGVNYNEDTKMITEIYPQIFDWLNLLNVNIRIILLLMVIVAAVNMITALLIIILEKTTMIGILKSFGSTDQSVSFIFIIHSAFLILTGILIGNVFSLAIIFLQQKFEIIKLPAESYYMDHVPVLFTWGRFILLNMATFVICTLIMFIPARYVAGIKPIKAIRFD